MSLYDAYDKILKGNGNTVTMRWPRPVFLLPTTVPPPPTRKSSDQLDYRTQLVIQKLRTTLDHRYFNRFHPIHSLVRTRDLPLLTEANVVLSSFKYSYLFEIAFVFNPQLHKSDFIDSACSSIEIADSDLTAPGNPRSFAFTVEDVRSRHARLIKGAMWKKIRELALIAGKDMGFARCIDLSQVSSPSQSPSAVNSSILPSQDTLITTPYEPTDSSPSPKHQSHASSLGWGSPDSSDACTEASTAASHLDRSVSEIVNHEI
jgi:hypothetical protein